VIGREYHTCACVPVNSWDASNAVTFNRPEGPNRVVKRRDECEKLPLPANDRELAQVRELATTDESEKCGESVSRGVATAVSDGE
jgi:hypothetical protein